MRRSDYGVWLGKDFYNRQNWLPIESPACFPDNGEFAGYLIFNGKTIGQFSIRSSPTAPKTDYYSLVHIWTYTPETFILPKVVAADKYKNNASIYLSSVCLAIKENDKKYAWSAFVGLCEYIKKHYKQMPDRCV